MLSEFHVYAQYINTITKYINYHLKWEIKNFTNFCMFLLMITIDKFKINCGCFLKPNKILSQFIYYFMKPIFGVGFKLPIRTVNQSTLTFHSPMALYLANLMVQTYNITELWDITNHTTKNYHCTFSNILLFEYIRIQKEK